MFDGVTNRLIPLFAIGAFLAFTLSQAGMVQHWRRHPGPRSRHALAVNALGALCTGITLAVVLVSKFVEGAWISVSAVAVGIVLFHRIHRYYARVSAETRCGPLLAKDLPKTPVVVVPMGSWNQVTQKALRLAVTLSPDVRAVQILGADAETRDLSGDWESLVEAPLREAGIRPPRFDCVPSGYRRLFAPLLDYIVKVRDERADRDVVVVIAEMVERRWYHALLRTHRASVLKALLLLKGGPRVIVVNTPWYLHD